MRNRLSCLVVAWLAVLPGLSTAAPPPFAPLAIIPIVRPTLPAATPSLAPSPPMPVLAAESSIGPVRLAPPATAEVRLCSRWGQGGQRVTYPACAATATAIVKMATHQVSSGRNRCAASVREALGWGLGDARQWLQLSDCGFTRRPREEPAQPGDIVVWPYTFGRRRSQHIGFAVGTQDGVCLLSNLSGGICVSGLAGGYCAFYKPAPPPPAPPSRSKLPALPTPQLRAGLTTPPAPVP